MSVFAGFWVDGAVRQPESRHGGAFGGVFVRLKDSSDLCTASVTQGAFAWDRVFWLDTTPRESLTPEELWSLVKVLFPSAVNVERVKGGGWMWNGGKEVSPHISWGDLTRYPPPAGEQWIQVTKENVSQHLFKDCRHRDREGVWRTGQIIGWSLDTDRCVVHNGYPDFCACVEVRLQGNE